MWVVVLHLSVHYNHTTTELLSEFIHVKRRPIELKFFFRIILFGTLNAGVNPRFKSLRKVIIIMDNQYKTCLQILKIPLRVAQE